MKQSLGTLEEPGMDAEQGVSEWWWWDVRKARGLETQGGWMHWREGVSERAKTSLYPNELRVQRHG